MAKQRWANQHVCLQHTRYMKQNAQFGGTLAQNMSAVWVGKKIYGVYLDLFSTGPEFIRMVPAHK